MSLVNFKRGDKPQNTSSLDQDTIYCFPNEQEIYLGPNKLAGNPEIATHDEVTAFYNKYVLGEE